MMGYHVAQKVLEHILNCKRCQKLLAEALKRARVHCLFETCGSADKDCGHDEYIVVSEKLTLKEAKKKYPEMNFCEDWVAEVSRRG